MTKNKIKGSIIDWNNRFPLDRQWRKKYKVSYLSEEHRKSIFFNQFFEYFEDKVYQDHYNKAKEEAKKRENNELKAKYKPMEGNWWKGKEATKEEAENWLKTPI